MIKTYFTFFGLLFSLLLFSQDETSFQHHCYFEEKGISVGLASNLSLNHSQWSPNARLYYNLRENICLGPEISYSKPHAEENILETNFVFHYIVDVKKMGVYPVFGASYLYEKINHQEEKFYGVVVGGGLHRNIKRFSIFTEYSHAFYHNLDEDKLSVGLFYMFKLH